MSEFAGRKIRELRESRGMNQRELGVAIGWEDSDATQRRISRWEKGQDIPEIEIRKLAEFFGIHPVEFYDFGYTTPPEYHPYIPVISWINAGPFAEAIDVYPVGVSGEHDPVSPRKKVGPRSFGLVVKNDSMSPRFLPGDIIIVDPDLGCENGDFCVVRFEGEVTFKKIRIKNGNIFLQSLNPKSYNIDIPKTSEADFKIIGRVVDMVPSFEFK